MKATNWRLLEVVVTWHHRANCNSPLAREYPTRLALFGTAADMTLAKRDCKTERLSQTLTLKCNQVEMKRETHPPPNPSPTKQREFTSAIIWSYFIFYWSIWLFSLQGRVCHYACNDVYSNDISLDFPSFAARVDSMSWKSLKGKTDDTPVKKSGCVVVDITQAAAMD